MYVVMEKANEIYVLTAEFGQTDLGSQVLLHTLLPQDENGNVYVGENVKLFECRNYMEYVADETKVVLEGLDGYIVVEKSGTLLVYHLTEKQCIREFSQT